jgi:hypothetical protein
VIVEKTLEGVLEVMAEREMTEIVDEGLKAKPLLGQEKEHAGVLIDHATGPKPVGRKVTHDRGAIRQIASAHLEDRSPCRFLKLRLGEASVFRRAASRRAASIRRVEYPYSRRRQERK